MFCCYEMDLTNGKADFSGYWGTNFRHLGKEVRSNFDLVLSCDTLCRGYPCLYAVLLSMRVFLII